MANPNTMKKLALVVLVGALAGAFWYFELGAILHPVLHQGIPGPVPGPLRRTHGAGPGRILLHLRPGNGPVPCPGAAVLTLAGGGLFGFATGLVLISFASSIGATLACLVARFVLRDFVQSRFKGQAGSRSTRAWKRKGLLPLHPASHPRRSRSSLINLAMGLTAIPLRTFYWVSQTRHAGRAPRST